MSSVNSRLLLVSNRLPVSARGRTAPLQIVKSSGGLATGLDEVRRTQQSLWIGWPGAAWDPSAPEWRDVEQRFHEEGLAPVPLSDDDVASYYDGFSNGVIWPLFHHLLDRVPIDSGNWNAYQRVNARFADAVARIWRPGDRIWVHDYHLMLVPELLRRELPDAPIGFFLHIPFPSTEVFRALPWRTEVLEGLLGADVIGFHTPAYVQHFLDSVRQVVGVGPVAEHVWWQGRAVHVTAMPMGVDAERFASTASRPGVRQRATSLRSEAHGRKILLGIDRLDYTKGIPRRLVAFQRLLERYPSLRNKVRFIQVAVPSRADVRAYKSFRRDLDELIGRINGMYGTLDAVPIHYLYQSVSPQELTALYCAADVMMVTPLRDGMNLVAKEFVASRTDEDGVLVLSEFAGAATELTDALIVNPYDVDGVADAMARALTLNREERRERMRRLRSHVCTSSVHAWASGFLERLEHAQPARVHRSAACEDAVRAFESGALVLHDPVTLLLDYDGTLVPFAELPDLAQPDPDLLNLLTALAAHPDIDLHLVTGRSTESVQRWFWQLPAGVWAEHGAACRRNAGPWERVVIADREWMDRAAAFLSDVCAHTPGALLERKTTSIAWHYRMVEPSLAADQLEYLKYALPEILGGAPVELIEGQMVLELRPRGVSKALVVRSLADGMSPSGSIVVIGDDQTDEEMFAALPRCGISIHVGGGESCATFRLPDAAAVRRFLARVLGTRGGRVSTRYHMYIPLRSVAADRG